MTIELRFVVFVNGSTSIADGEGKWWCGDEHGWVHPGSSYWDLEPDCLNEVFLSFKEAVDFAIEEGWMLDLRRRRSVKP